MCKIKENEMKKIIWKLLNYIGIGGIVQLQLKSGLKEDGWFKSFHSKQSIDASGEPLAWYNYGFLKFLLPRLQKNFEVFEYGAGNSTIWYAKNVKNVTSVENDKKWVEILSPKLPNNAKVIFKEINEKQDYQQEIATSHQKYDIIVVDGRRRNDCVMFAVDYLTPKGIMILDNAEREDYQPARNFMEKKGFKRIDFWGISPIVAQNTCTCVFYRLENCLDI